MTKSPNRNVPQWGNDNELTESIFLHILEMRKMVLERLFDFMVSFGTELDSLAIDFNEFHKTIGTEISHDRRDLDIADEFEEIIKDSTGKNGRKIYEPLPDIEKNPLTILNDDNAYTVVLNDLLAKDWEEPLNPRGKMYFMVAASRFYETLTTDGKFYLESDLPEMLTIDRRVYSLCETSTAILLRKKERTTATSKKIGEVISSKEKLEATRILIGKTIPYIKSELIKKYPDIEELETMLIQEYPKLQNLADEIVFKIRAECKLSPPPPQKITRYFKKKYKMPAEGYPQKLPLIIKGENWFI